MGLCPKGLDCVRPRPADKIEATLRDDLAKLVAK
jgi:hypothetical protein